VGPGPAGVLLEGGRGQLRLSEIVSGAFAETWALHERREVPLRSAAYGLGVQRVAEASVIRGLYP